MTGSGRAESASARREKGRKGDTGPARWRARLTAVVLLLGAWAAGLEPVCAQSLTDHPERALSAPEPGVLPGLAALVPGLLLHGSGTYVAKDRPAAKRLAIASGAGVGAVLLSGTLLAVTGTSRRLVGAMAPIALAGTGVFALTWLADLYGATTGGRDASAASWVAPIELELGYRYVRDPQFAYGSFGYARADLRYKAWRAAPSAFVALDADNQRLGLDLAYRMRGRHAKARTSDGSFLDLATGLLHHRYGREGFAVWTPSLALEGRLDLAHVGESLRGAFVEGQLGAGLELYHFDAVGARPRENAFGLLLGRFGFGIYLGNGTRRTGEVSLYYDHRHDDFAAGAGLRGIASGVLGHLGSAGHYFFDERWGASLMLEVGSAVVAGAALRYRQEASP